VVQPSSPLGVVDRGTGSYWRFTRTARGATEAGEEELHPDQAAERDPGAWATASEELDLLSAIGADLDHKSFLAGESSPVFFGSALTNFGIRLLMDAVVQLAPAPSARPDAAGRPRPVDAPFSGFAFQVQANMDPAHRDRIAFVRVCSGRFDRGMTVTLARTGRPFATKYAHQLFGSDRETIDEAFPGDVVGLVNASDVRVGDTLYLDAPVEFPGIPTFAPELFRRIRTTDTGRFKQFRRALEQLDDEGVIQVLRDDEVGDVQPVLAAVGEMQFQVATWRIENEFGAPVELTNTPYRVARLTDEASTPEIRRLPGATVLRRRDGALLALFESAFYLQRIESERDHLVLQPLLV
jgi:peptide chain release factor 3